MTTPSPSDRLSALATAWVFSKRKSIGCAVSIPILAAGLIGAFTTQPSLGQATAKPHCETVDAHSARGKTDGYINVIASVNLTKGTAAVKYVSHTQIPTQPGPVRQRLVVVGVQDKTGCQLGAFGATWLSDSDKAPNDENTGIAVISFPFSATMTSITLISNNKMLSTYRLESESGGVSGLIVKSHSGLTEHDRSLLQSAGRPFTDNSLLAEWTSTSKNGSADDYTVQLSLDGTTWSTLAVALKTTHYQLDADQFGLNMGDRAYLRVSSNRAKGDNASMTVPFVVH